MIWEKLYSYMLNRRYLKLSLPHGRGCYLTALKKKKKIKNAIVQRIDFPYDYDFIVYFQIYWNNSSFRINKLFHECC